MINYYHVLGLNESASPDEIKAAFKRLAVQFHPDKHPGRQEMEEKFKEINEAHQILSDPYEKARFDLKLKYQQFNNENTRRDTHASGATRATYRRRYAAPPIDYKENAKATLYAFAITFAIALFVMSGVWSYRWYQSNQLQKLLASRRATFELAQKKYQDGDFKTAYEMLSSFNFFKKEEQDIRLFKDRLITSVAETGKKLFYQNKQKEAIEYLEAVIEFESHLPNYEEKELLALAYRSTGFPRKSIQVLEKLLLDEFKIIQTLAMMGEIYRDELDDDQKALEYYSTGNRLIIKRYKAFYGKAYSLVINEKHIPKSHYRLYTGLASLYYEMDNLEMAKKAAIWNKYVWPDSTDSYVVTAKAYVKEENWKQACNEYFEATARGWSGETPERCF